MAAVHETCEEPRSAERPPVGSTLEDRDSLGCRAQQIVRGSLRLAPQPDVLELDSRAPLDARIFGLPRSGDRLGQHRHRAVRILRGNSNETELAEQLAAKRMVDRKKRRGPLEQVRRSMDVAAPQRARSGGTESPSRFLGELIRLAKFRAQTVSLLEVVPDELVELGEIRIHLIQAAGEALVQLRPEPLGRGPVDRLLDEHVPEAERALAVRPDEASLRQRVEVRLGCVRDVGIEQRRDVVGRELLADDRAALEHRALSRPEPVEPRREQRLDRLGHRPLTCAFEREGKKLFEEQRIALGGVDDAVALVGLEDRAAETLEQRVRLLGRERVEHDPLRVGEERRAILEQLFAREADDQHRAFALRRRRIRRGRGTSALPQ